MRKIKCMQHTTAMDDSVISVSSLGMNDDSGRLL